MTAPQSIHEVPFVRLLLPLVGGIVFELSFGWGLGDSQLAMLIVLVFLFLVATHFFVKAWRWRWVYGLLLNVFLFLSGFVLSVSPAHNNSVIAGKTYRAIVRLSDAPLQRARSIRAECVLEHLWDGDNMVEPNESVLLYFSISDTAALQLSYGDLLAVEFIPRGFDKPKNPYQFDIQKYMERKGIRYSSFLRADGWMHLGNNGNRIVAYSLRVRDYFLAQFSRYGVEGEQLAVVSALVLGYKDLLDDELRRVYSSTGAMHVLAVSGLHVGILYFLLALLLRVFPLGRYRKMLTLPILLTFLWFYALLTGLSPSVCRAALMFSLVAVGQVLGTQSNVFNTLSVAAFALLVVDPSNLLNVGFQLSFAAVLSIVVFYPYINRLFYVRSRVLGYIWSLVAVSIAAQIGTFPFTTMYFAQFPNYFIVTNLIAIPLSTVILYLSVLLLAVSPIPAIAGWLGKLLNLLLAFMNDALGWVEALPFSLINAIHISVFQFVLLLLGLLALALFLLSRRIRYLQALLVMLTIVVALCIPRRVGVATDELVVFSVPRSSEVCIRCNGEAHFISHQSSLERNGFYVDGYVKHQTLGGRCRNIWAGSEPNGAGIAVKARDGLSFVTCRNMILVLPYNDSLQHISAVAPIAVDVLLANRHFSDNLLNIISPKQVVVDESFPRWKIDKLMVRLAELNIPVHSTYSLGAMRCPIP